jgi:hypothetical protein
MQMTVGTAAVAVGTTEARDSYQSGQVVVLQNLGPGDIYVDFANTVTAANGFKISVNGAYEFPRTANEQEIYVIASVADTDVRVLLVD